MANVFNKYAGLWIIDTEDILSFTDQTDHNSGLRPICVKMIRFRPNATGNGAQLMACNPNADPTLTISEDTYTVTSTYRITDDSAGGVFNGASIGDWLHLHTSSSGNNLGWWYITGVDGSYQYVDVEYSTAALTNDASAVYQIKIYTPETAAILVSETGDTGAKSIKTETINFGPNGRWFQTLSAHAISASSYIDIYTR